MAVDETEMAVGVVLLVLGLGIAFWGFDKAEEMGIMKYEYPEQYDTYNLAGLGGLGLAAIGGGLAVYGIGSGSSRMSQEQAKVAWSGPSGQPVFCQYCGRPLAADAVYCPSCGRGVRK